MKGVSPPHISSDLLDAQLHQKWSLAARPRAHDGGGEQEVL